MNFQDGYQATNNLRGLTQSQADENDTHPVVIKLLPLHQAPFASRNHRPPSEAFQPTQQQQVDTPLLGSSASSPTFVRTYLHGLSMLLGAWVAYLLLPKGARKAYCRASRRRYKRGNRVKKQPPIETVPSVDDSVLKQIETKRRNETEEEMDDARELLLREYHQAREENSTPRQSVPQQIDREEEVTPTREERGGTPRKTLFGGSPEVTARQTASSSETSPMHPGLTRIPDLTILEETRRRLQHRGIRLIAHGVHCEPKRVWIQLNTDTDSFEWRTEFPRRITNQVGISSVVLMRGATHAIPLPNIVYVDVGKRTAALQKQTNLLGNLCFSLLTNNGSLDLQTHSKLERDALVSCLSQELDRVHKSDWRALYQNSSEANYAPSQVTGVMSNISSENFPSMTARDI